MKNNFFITLLLIPIMLVAQKIELDVKGPIDSHFGEIIGNDDIGYIKFITEGNDVTIYVLNKVDFTYKSKSLHKGMAADMFYSKRFFILDNEVYLFYQKVEKMLVQENLFYCKINMNTGELGEEKLLINTEEIDNNPQYNWYSYGIFKHKDKLCIATWVKEKAINFRVYESDINKIWEANIEYNENQEKYDIEDFYFDDERMQLIIYAKEIIKSKEKDKLDLSKYYILSVKGDNQLIEKEFNLEKLDIVSAEIALLNNNEYCLQGISYSESQKSFKVFSININDEFSIIDNEEIQIVAHPNMNIEKNKNEIKLNYYKHSKTILDDNSNVSCFKAEDGTGYTFLLIVKYNANGEIVFTKNLTTKRDGYGNQNHFYIL